MNNKYFHAVLPHSSVSIFYWGLLLSTSNLFAAPLVFPQSPPGNGGKEPAPNVIVSVDDSGSMGQAGIDTLKAALTQTFSSTNVPDDRIRLAWQSMNRCSGIPSYSAACGGLNVMKTLSGSHRSDFLNWVSTLTYGGGTPSHVMTMNAGEYLKSTSLGINSPWASVPGSTLNPILACRRAYHIFMTDGDWNSGNNGYPYTNGSVDGDRDSTPTQPGNADGTARTLPDGTAYPPTGIGQNPYKDNWGFSKSQAGSMTYYNYVVGSWQIKSWQPDNLSTLSDLAFHYWATDLQPSMADQIKPIINAPGNESFNISGQTYTLPEYWNPKNDPAVWQHMTTYTIGFSSNVANSVTSWSGTPVWGGDTYSGDYSNLVRGTVTWPSPLCQADLSVSPDAVGGNNACDDALGYGARSNARKIELWHAAINGRGKFVPAPNASALVTAFQGILNNIIVDTSKPLVAISANTTSLKSGAYSYIAGYDAANWSGALTSRAINSSTGAVSSTETWNAATLLDNASYAVNSRFVLSYNGTTGISWNNFSSLPTTQKTVLNQNSSATVDNNGQNRMDYLRGDRTKEVAQSNGIFRNRSSRLGDIVNSNIAYVGKPNSGYTANSYGTFRSTNTSLGGKGGRTSMVYVGANDGMLHGFAAANWPSDTATTIAGGTELLAYIPQGIAETNLRKLTDTGYSHQYFVDGSPSAGDAYIGTTPTWKTVLTGTLGAGGKGYFVLDVTDPAQFTVANAANLVLVDTTSAPDVDVGNILSPPAIDDVVSNKSQQIVKMNNGRWAVVMGNGYNSSNEAPVLVVQYLDGDKTAFKVSPCTQPIATNACTFKGSNGLSTPMLIDLNGDGSVDVAYAGDLKGNLWKFNLSSSTPGNWNVSFSGQPFFVAQPSATVTQPITTAPYWMPHPNGGIMVLVGTGQNLTLADQTSTGTDSVYALYDKSTYTNGVNSVTITDGTVINTVGSTSVPASLVQQTITGTVTDNGTTYYNSSSNPVLYTGASPKRGWYLNWFNAGQRVLVNNRLFSGQKVLIQSSIPKSGGASSGETCTPSSGTERIFLSALNMFTGMPSTLPAFPLSNSTISNSNITGIEITGLGDNILMRTRDDNGVLIGTGSSTGSKSPPQTYFGKYLGTRANWREIQ